MPLVSILTPSFDQGRFIGDCIASVQSQTYLNVEHVICDGGSTDSTLDVLRRAPASVRWTSRPDRGQADAINRAFSRSRGEIVGWLNADDAYFDRRAIQRVVDVFARHSDVDVVYGHAALVGADNELLHLIWAPPFSAWLLKYATFIVQPTAFIRRSALGDSLVDESLDYALDRELWLRLSADGHRFERLDCVVAIDRHHQARKSYTMADAGDRENAALDVAYGSPAGVRRRVVLKAFKVGSRMVGARLLRRAREGAAFDVRVGRSRALLRRQLVTPRRFMPMLHGPDGPR